MKSYQTWLVVLAVLAVNLQDASAQFDNTIVSRRSTITSTMTSFTNNINSKVTDYTNKFTSLRNDMSSQLNSASQTVTTFLTDSVIGANALLASDVLAAANVALSANVSTSINVTSTGFSGVGSCLNTKTLTSVNATFEVLVAANANFSTVITRSTSSFTSTCRARYTNTANDLVNQFADRTQECVNIENTELSRVSSILNNYMSLMRQNFQGLYNHVRYCSMLGSTSSRGEVKAEISACFKGVSTFVAPIYKANLEQQFILARTMLQLEVVASNNRVKTCLNQVAFTYQAMAEAIGPALNTCLTNGQ